MLALGPYIKSAEGLPMLDPDTKEKPLNLARDYGDMCLAADGFAQVRSACVSMYGCMYVFARTCVYARVHVHMSLCMCVRMLHLCSRVRLCARTYVLLHIYLCDCQSYITF